MALAPAAMRKIMREGCRMTERFWLSQVTTKDGQELNKGLCKEERWDSILGKKWTGAVREAIEAAKGGSKLGRWAPGSVRTMLCNEGEQWVLWEKEQGWWRRYEPAPIRSRTGAASAQRSYHASGRPS